jgi:hypothetical protein
VLSCILSPSCSANVFLVASGMCSEPRMMFRSWPFFSRRFLTLRVAAVSGLLYALLFGGFWNT